MTFEGKFFDGKTSTGYAAHILLASQHIEIVYDNGTSIETVYWQPANIHPDDFGMEEKVLLKYGELPYQYLEVSHPQFAKELKETYPQAKFHKGPYHVVFSWGIWGLVGLTAAFAAVLALAYFVILPNMAEKIAMQIPIAWEQQIGDAAYNQMLQGENTDEENSQRLNAFFKTMHYKTDYDIEIVMVKDNLVNAFALPGGKIMVYQGILRTMDKPEELAALLSHEFSHVELRHSTRNIFRSLSNYMLISILFGDASGVTAVIIQNADQLKQLGYSRQLEEDADRNGLKLMKQRHINPEGMIQLFEKLKQEEGSMGNIPEFLSSHPLTTGRIDYIKKDIALKDYLVTDDSQLDSLWKEIKSNLEE